MAVAGGPAAAQSMVPLGGRVGPPIEGASGVAPAPPPPVLSGHDPHPKRHLGPTGKPCLMVMGTARPQVINPNIYEHVIAAKNACSQIIKIQACYRGAERCVPLTVTAYARRETVLGIQPAAKEFRFEYREQFP